MLYRLNSWDGPSMTAHCWKWISATYWCGTVTTAWLLNESISVRIPSDTHVKTTPAALLFCVWASPFMQPSVQPWQGCISSLLLAWPGSKGLLSHLPPPIVCDSWKPSELIQTAAHSAAPPLLLLLPSPFSFLFHSLFQSVLPLFLFLHPLLSHGLTMLIQSVTFTYRAGAVWTPGGEQKKTPNRWSALPSVVCATSLLLLNFFYHFYDTELIAPTHVAVSQPDDWFRSH